MLKIRDDIPLEELEKYGFEYKKIKDLEIWEHQNGADSFRIIYVVVRSREINNYNESDKLYDLIQAGIVVKE